MEILKKLLSSKKFIVAMAGLLASIGAKVGLEPELGNEVAMLIIIAAGSYVGAQGLADFGKEAKPEEPKK